MGLWNAAGRWLAFAVGTLLVILGANSVWHGLDIIQVERGWTGVIAGTMGFSAGVLTILLTILIDRVDALRSGLLAHRAVQAVDAAAPLPVPVIVPVPEAAHEPQPQPIEVPVEPPPMPAAPAPSRMTMPAFSFRPFGKRSGAETPALQPVVAPIETMVPPPEPLTPAPSQDEEPPEPIRRYAPPQFRRPVMPPVAEEAPEPVAQPVAEPAQVEVEIQQDVATTIEEVQLPRVSSLPPLPPIEPEPVQMAEVEPPAPPPPPEPAPPHRGIADTHAWLEKALAGEEEPDPALDWLRQRRPADEVAPERKVPSFMRRHAEAAEDDAVASQVAQPAEPAEAAAPATPPSVVGRYNANGSEYTLYADGTIDAQTPAGPRHFGSMAELRAFLEQQNAEA